MAHIVFPDTERAYGLTTDIGDVMGDFAVATRAWPDNSAVVHNGTAYTYRQLERRVQVAAARYRAGGRGSAPLGLAGALVSHTPAAVDQLLGILRAGGTYCPIDAALPTVRKQELAAVLGLDRLYAPAPHPDRSGNVPVEVIDPADEYGYTELPEPIWLGDDPAYILCTSGSTGVPKPVVVSRRALTVAVRGLRRLFGLTPEDRVLQFASLGWDTCFEEILPALTAGATVVFDDDAYAGSLPRFVRMLSERQVSVLDLPTAFWHELVLFLHDARLSLPNSVRLIIIGGERVDPTRLRQWRELDVGHIRLLNTYGCTETTMVTHAVQLWGRGTEAALTDSADVPIGRALPHVGERLSDEGELLVSGPCLATGYLGLPELTASAFPIADRGGGATRWFHTGDLVSRGTSGLLYPCGRVDEQVKVLGVRVHPAEIEAHLNAHPAVAGAVVIGERRQERTVLTAFVVRSGYTDQSHLKQFLRERLPSQFVPSQIKFIAALSYTASGKIDRSATRRAAQDDNKGVTP